MKKILSILSILTLAILTGCSNIETTENNDVGVPESETSATIESSTTKKTYTSDKFSLSFDYPDNWTVYEDEMQIDVQPPQPAVWSNYFTVETLDSSYSPYKTLEDFRKAMKEKSPDLKETVLIIDGKTAYLEDPNPLMLVVNWLLLYLRFSHNNKVYSIHFFREWYEMPEVQEMIKSLRFN